MDFVLVDGDFNEVIEYTMAEIEPLLKEKNLNVKIDIATTETKAVFYKLRMIQVMVNLFSNAIKFSPENGIILVTLKRYLMPSGDFVLYCSVSDEGDGIPDGELDAIFNKFIQNSKTKSGAGGTGLGLSISKEVILAHGGKILAENGKDKGAIFSFFLPVDKG